MVTNLKRLIIQQIRDNFTGVKIYDEPVKQGLETPAFLVLIFNAIQDRKLNLMVERDFAINVTYFPHTEDKRYECDAILQTFNDEFRYIADKYHVHNIEGRVSDDVLVITFNVKALLTEVVEGVKMEELGGVTIE